MPRIARGVAVEEFPSVEQYVTEIMIGDCPICGSKHTKDCDEAVEIEFCDVAPYGMRKDEKYLDS